MNYSRKLEPKYKSILSQSGLLLPELSTLASSAEGKELDTQIKKLVIEKNVLAKPTAQSRQRIWKKLIARYRIHDGDEPLVFWWRLIPASANSDLAQLGALRWAQHDLLLRFLWNEIYFPRRNMGSAIQSSDLIGFIKAVDTIHPGRRFFLGCSENVQVRMAQHFLLLLRECGAATGRKNKLLATPPVGKNAVRFAAYLARRERPGSSQILQHWALSWWGASVSKADEILREGS